MTKVKTKIPKEILNEVYQTALSSPSPTKTSPSKKHHKATEIVIKFIIDGCKFNMGPKYAALAHRAQRGMSTQHVNDWCKGQTFKLKK